jgi:hypothetical protein
MNVGHMIGVSFAAAAAAVALLEIADERPVFERERQTRREWQLERFREILAQVIVDSGRVGALRRPPKVFGAARRPYLENLSGIEKIFRIERAFDFAHDAEQLIAKLFGHVFGARDADAVLGGERALELPDQRRSLIRDLPEFF